jgi:hypothetical protein
MNNTNLYIYIYIYIYTKLTKIILPFRNLKVKDKDVTISSKIKVKGCNVAPSIFVSKFNACIIFNMHQLSLKLLGLG